MKHPVLFNIASLLSYRNANTWKRKIISFKDKEQYKDIKYRVKGYRYNAKNS
jgi:hypothetical protein